MFLDLLVGMLRIHAHVCRVERAGCVADAIVACAEHRPDLLILDLKLPDGDSLAVARALQALNPSARAIVLSSYASTFQRPPELRQMIMAIIDKSRAFQDLAQAVEALVPEMARQRQQEDAMVRDLTERELQVLQGLGRGLSSLQIADQLGLSVRTVETHRSTLGGKLGVHGSALVQQATLLIQRLQR